MDKKITALETQKRNPDRLNVYLDGEFAFGISKFVGAWLSVGQSVTEDKIRELTDQDEREKALQTALKYIGYRPRTNLEVKKKLEKAGYEAEITASVLSELNEKQYLNDREFARQWVDLRSESKPRGRFLLSIELRTKGIPDDIIESVLSAIPEEKRLAEEFGEKYMRRLTDVDQETFIRKMSGALQRKGFSYSVTKEVVGKLWKQRPMAN
jgi:regulatory protein